MPTVLITGANRGIGLEFAAQYAAEGWQVFAGARDPQAANDLQRLVRESQGRVRALRLDVTDIRSVREAATEVGGAPIDVLINNAGVPGGPRQRLGDIDYELWKQVLDINALGPVRVVEAFVENLARSERKLSVAITSGMGSIADNSSGGYIIYRTSKTALNMAMRTLSIDLAPRGIVCVVINPGWVKTRMGGAGARITPETSVRGMRKVLDAVNMEQTGRFLNWDGREYPW